MHMQIMVRIYPFLLKILSKQNLWTLIKAHNSVINLPALVHNNPNLDPFLHIQNIEMKQNFDTKMMRL